ncbi:hypothetical protein GCM10008906_01900 [Clostridium oceanicum]|uniref:Uncharacterized protein n=1 Tax=Clostridium oceanicum TaxID=1543 RepID=A0ABP3UHW4_9CLOT
MKSAIVTGASSGIGFEISKSLINLGYKVYGIGRDFSKVDFCDENFIKVVCDILNTNILCKTVRDIKKKRMYIY